MNFKKTPARAIVMMAALFIFLFTQMADSFARYGSYRSSYRPSYSSYRSYSSFRSTSSFSSYRASRPYGMRPSSFSMSARNSFRVYPKSINSFSSISRTTKFTGGVTKSGYPIVTGKSGRKFSVSQSGMLSGKSAANMAYQRTERTRYNINGTINKAQTRIEKIARGKSGVDKTSSIPLKILFEPKIEKQMSQRGWTSNSVKELIKQPHKTIQVRDTRFDPATKTRLDDPATAYIAKDGSCVVRNDKNGAIVQISDRTDPKWRSPWEK